MIRDSALEATLLNSEQYSKIVMDHFDRPRNAGPMTDPHGVGTAGGQTCSDILTISIRVCDDHISEIAFQCQGCPAAIACASMTTELAKGKHLDAAAEIADDTVAQALGGLSPDKRHCSNLGAEALSNAIMDYVMRQIEAQHPSRDQ